MSNKTQEAQEHSGGGIAFDEERIASMISQGVQEAVNAETEEKSRETETEERKLDLNPGADAVAREIEVGRAREEKEAYRAFHTLRLMQGSAHSNNDAVQDATRKLIKGGHYGERAAELLGKGKAPVDAVRAAEKEERAMKEQRVIEGLGENQSYRAAGDYYSTLVNADGAHLLPTVVVQQIEEIAERVGVVQQAAQTFNHIVGTLKVPGASGADSKMTAVGEGSAITARKRDFQAIELNPQKVADIIPWTYEINVEAGPQILADIQRVMGRAYGKAVDDHAINGDGTSSFNDQNGILSSNRSSVADYDLGGSSSSGSVSFDDIDFKDVFLARRQVPAGVRDMGAYMFHPDMEAKFRTLNTQGDGLLYSFNADTGVGTLGGKPVFYTEVLPDISADSTDTIFGIFGAWSYLKIALGPGMETEEMRTGTVTDADTGDDINLGTQDLRALKYRAFFDLDMNFESAFTTISTAAS